MPFEITAYVPRVVPGAYQAVCTQCDTKAAKDGSGEFRVWEFTLRDGTGRTVGATSSLSTTQKSKGGKWLTALLGHAPQVGEIVDPIGKPCTILVELSDDGYEKVAYVTAPEQAAPHSGQSFAQTPDAKLPEQAPAAATAAPVPTLPTRVIPEDSDDLPF
jgi:hypothetical protein